jgi:hypothetical protein
MCFVWSVPIAFESELERVSAEVYPVEVISFVGEVYVCHVVSTLPRTLFFVFKSLICLGWMDT